MCGCVFFLMMRRPPRSTQSRSSAASDVYKRQHLSNAENGRVMLSLKALLKLRDIFECTLDELVDPDRFEKKKERVKRYKLVRCSE